MENSQKRRFFKSNLTLTTNLSVKYRIKDDVIYEFKNAEIEFHNIATEFINKAFKFNKNKSTYNI